MESIIGADMSKDKLKIRIVVEVEVDRAEYDKEYGEKASADDIRAHVKGSVGSAAQGAFQHIPAIEVKDWE